MRCSRHSYQMSGANKGLDRMKEAEIEPKQDEVVCTEATSVGHGPILVLDRVILALQGHCSSFGGISWIPSF